jgi:predicted Zn finger-like uncharacterized protein
MNDLLGMAVCDECNSRIRLFKRHEPLIGKTVRCPKCHTNFTLTLETPTNTDKIAVEAEQEEEQQQKKRKRSKDEIRAHHITTASEGFRALHGRLKEIAQASSSSEEQVRIWCVDALKTALGFNYTQIDTELKALNGRVDIAIKNGDAVQMVIECKNIKAKLNNSVRDQAGAYAATLSAPWAVVTNGEIWKLYRVTPQPGKPPSVDKVFDVALLDEDGVSESDAENLYLLSHRALSSGDTENGAHKALSTSPQKVYDALFSERVLDAVRLELTQSYKSETNQNVKITNEEAKEAMRGLFTPLNFG